MLTRQDVADLLGVKVNTIDVWRRRPSVGFPQPDGKLGDTPWWKPSTIAAFRRNRRASGYWGHTAHDATEQTETSSPA